MSIMFVYKLVPQVFRYPLNRISSSPYYHHSWTTSFYLPLLGNLLFRAHLVTSTIAAH
jgi:hypothetical protein